MANTVAQQRLPGRVGTAPRFEEVQQEGQRDRSWTRRRFDSERHPRRRKAICWSQAEGNGLAGYFMVNQEELWFSWLAGEVADKVKAVLQQAAFRE